MPYQPTYPSPYMETIDVTQDGGNIFKCLINPKDTVTGARISISHNNADEFGETVYVGSSVVRKYVGGEICLDIDDSIELYKNLSARLNNGETLTIIHNDRDETGIIKAVDLSYNTTKIFANLSVLTDSNATIGINCNITIYSNVFLAIPLDESLFPFVGGVGDTSWLQSVVDTPLLYNGSDYNWYITLTMLSHRTIFSGTDAVYDSTKSVTIDVKTDEVTIAGLNREIQSGTNFYFSVNDEIYRITSFSLNMDTVGLRLENSLSSTPPLGARYEIYATSSTITSPKYYFKARKNPIITFDVPDTIVASAYDFSATYEQEQHVGIAYYEFNLYSYGELIDSSGRIFSHDIKYSCKNLVSGNEYSIELIVVTDDGVNMRDERSFSVAYEYVYTGGLATISVDNHHGCICVDYSDVEYLTGTERIVTGCLIQRYEQESGRLCPVTTLNKEYTSFRDYNLQNHKTYRYQITPIYLYNEQKQFGAPVKTSAIQTDWSGWSIIGLKQTSKANEYTVDNDNIWVFEYNTTGDPIKPVFNKSYATGFGQYPKEIQGEENYLEGSVSGLIGSISCNGDYINDDIDSIERWREFCNTAKLKLLKDPKGHVIPCSIKDTSPTINYNVREEITTVSFGFVQLADRNDISVYGLEV